MYIYVYIPEGYTLNASYVYIYIYYPVRIMRKKVIKQVICKIVTKHQKTILKDPVFCRLAMEKSDFQPQKMSPTRKKYKQIPAGPVPQICWGKLFITISTSCHTLHK